MPEKWPVVGAVQEPAELNISTPIQGVIRRDRDYRFPVVPAKNFY